MALQEHGIHVASAVRNAIDAPFHICDGDARRLSFSNEERAWQKDRLAIMRPANVTSTSPTERLTRGGRGELGYDSAAKIDMDIPADETPPGWRGQVLRAGCESRAPTRRGRVGRMPLFGDNVERQNSNEGTAIWRQRDVVASLVEQGQWDTAYAGSYERRSPCRRCP